MTVGNKGETLRCKKTAMVERYLKSTICASVKMEKPRDQGVKRQARGHRRKRVKKGVPFCQGRNWGMGWGIGEKTKKTKKTKKGNQGQGETGEKTSHKQISGLGRTHTPQWKWNKLPSIGEKMTEERGEG